MAFPDTTPRKGDSDNNLLFKIAQELSERNGGAYPPQLGDSDNNLLYKIAQLVILGGAGGTCAADLAALQAQIAVFQDFGISWTPGSVNMMGSSPFSNTAGIAGLTTLTFRGTSYPALTVSGQPNLTSLSLLNVISVSGGITANSNPNLTSFSAPVLTTNVGGSLNLSSNAALTSVLLPALIHGQTITISGPVTAIDLPSMTDHVGSLTLISTVAATINLPVLVSCAGSFVFSSSSVTAILLPVFATQTGSSNISIANCAALTSFSLAALTSMGTSVTGITGNACTSMTSLSIPLLVTAGRLLFNGCTVLSSVTLTSYLPTNGRVQNFNACALTEASVDHVLARCVANAAYVSGTISLDGGTNATPGGQGLLDKAILQARGCTVNTN